MRQTKMHDRYHDIQDLVSDPKMARVVEYLERSSRAIEVPFLKPPLDIEQINRLSSNKKMYKNFYGIRNPHPLIGILMFLLVIFLTGSSLGVFSILDRAFLSEPETAGIIIGNQGQTVSLSQSFDGFTVTVERVYADEKQIIVGYKVSGPPERKFSNFALFGTYSYDENRLIATMPLLFDDEGRLYLASSTSWGSGVYDGYGGYILKYEINDPKESVEKLNLRLEANALQAIEIIPATNETRTLIIHHPFVYDFTVGITRR